MQRKNLLELLYKEKHHSKFKLKINKKFNKKLKKKLINIQWIMTKGKGSAYVFLNYILEVELYYAYIKRILLSDCYVI